MSLRRSGATRLRALAASALALTMAPGVATAAADPSWPTLASAYRTLLADGRPMLVVVTSGNNPESGRLASEVATRPEFVRLRPALQFVELSAEADPGWMVRLKVKHTPCLLLYRRNAANKAEMVSRQDAPTSAENSIRWLSAAMTRTKLSASIAPPAPTREVVALDPEVEQTGGHAEASSQQAQATPQQPRMETPEPPTKAPPAYSPPAYAPPVYAPPAYAPPPQYVPQPQYVPVPSPQPVVVQTAPSPVLIQQQAPNIMIQPAPPPNITILGNAPTAGPTITYVNQAPPAQAPPAMAPPVGNAPPVLPSFAPPTQPFANAPQPGYAPQPLVTYAQAPQPMMAYAPAPQPAYAPPAQAPPAAAPPAQAPAAQAPLVVSNPRLFGRVLGAVGEGLSQFKNPRLQMAQAHVAAAPVAQNAPGIIPVYAQQPPAGYGYPPQPVYGQPPYGPPPGYGPPPYYPPPGQGYYPGPPPPNVTTPSAQDQQQGQGQASPGLIHRMLRH
jgi:hypothetical protein